MDDEGDFTTLLRVYMVRAVRSNRDLAQLTGIAIRTIEGWTSGEMRRPRYVSDVLKVARGLLLDAEDAAALLQAVQHPPLAIAEAQASQMDDAQLRELVVNWQSAP